jgi:pimeloyl-ACP methyl ester carboxylesterase
MSAEFHDLRTEGFFRAIEKLKGQATPDPPLNALVFVHGIFSQHATFQPLVDGLRAQPALADWKMFYFDYDFYRSIIDSGKDLAEVLLQTFVSDQTAVTIVGHSMGGLVGRAALLQNGDMGFVKRLVMLGTPNHGTLHSSRLGVLAEQLRRDADTLAVVLPRKAMGIKQLTKINKTLQPFITKGGLQRTRSVEYVTIPALRFHSDADDDEAPPNTAGYLRFLARAMRLMRMLPGMHIELHIPHDGIVEERCVRLSGEPGNFSERPYSGAGGPAGAPYLHLTHPDYNLEDHVTVQKANRTIQLLADLLQTPDLLKWRAQLASTGEPFNLFP